MASIATSSDLPPLGEPHARAEIGRELEATLHELLDLSLIGRQLQWAVVGPLSQPLRLKLDELVDCWRELADTVARRAVTLGYIPDGQARTIAAGSQLSPVAHSALEDQVAVWEATHRIATVSELVRARMDRIREVDTVSQDVLVEVVRTLEEQQWMLRAYLGERT